MRRIACKMRQRVPLVKQTKSFVAVLPIKLQPWDVQNVVLKSPQVLLEHAPDEALPGIVTNLHSIEKPRHCSCGNAVQSTETIGQSHPSSIAAALALAEARRTAAVLARAVCPEARCVGDADFRHWQRGAVVCSDGRARARCRVVHAVDVVQLNAGRGVLRAARLARRH